MTRFVKPRTFLIGSTAIDNAGLLKYLEVTGQQEFLSAIAAARLEGLNDADILCSFFAKLCYASLVEGRNDNLTRTRGIRDNVLATLEAGHGSVFEHVTLNWVTTDCSRILTHELVRHRTGTAFSQTSGRYVRTDQVRLVWDPILDPVSNEIDAHLEELEHLYRELRIKTGLGTAQEVEDYLAEADEQYETGERLRHIPHYRIEWTPKPFGAKRAEARVTVLPMSFSEKKKLTSALRRVLPNGQPNEIGWSVNLRQLRHMVMLRTSAGAEWEIRQVFNDVYRIAKDRFPLMFHGAKEVVVDGLVEVSGLKLQPYEEKCDG